MSALATLSAQYDAEKAEVMRLVDVALSGARLTTGERFKLNVWANSPPPDPRAVMAEQRQINLRLKYHDAKERRLPDAR